MEKILFAEACSLWKEEKSRDTAPILKAILVTQQVRST
jgi:hypothetical protein